MAVPKHETAIGTLQLKAAESQRNCFGSAAGHSHSMPQLHFGHGAIATAKPNWCQLHSQLQVYRKLRELKGAEQSEIEEVSCPAMEGRCEPMDLGWFIDVHGWLMAD